MVRELQNVLDLNLCQDRNNCIRASKRRISAIIITRDTMTIEFRCNSQGKGHPAVQTSALVKSIQEAPAGSEWRWT